MDDNKPKRQTLGLKQVPSYIQKLQELKQQVKSDHILERKDEQKDYHVNGTVPYFKRDEVIKALNWLYETFPKCFFQQNQKPLKININKDVIIYLRSLEASDSLPSRSALRKALCTYTRNRFYLQACIQGAKRIDLQGLETTEISEKEAAYAAALDAKYAESVKQKKAAKRKDGFKKNLKSKKHEPNAKAKPSE